MSSTTPATASAASIDHVHHPNADHSVEFHGLAVYEKGGDVKPFSYNPPKLQSDWVEVAITHCGICGSDCHIIDSGFGRTNYPVIPGHEIIGEVVAAGSDVKKFKIGDRVGIGAQGGACLNKDGNCPECAAGLDNHCTKARLSTVNSKYPDGQVAMGGYSERVRLTSNFVFKIPDVISSAEAAPLLCGGITVYAPLARSINRPGMKVGIIGIGGLGHLAVQFASKLQNGQVEVTAISSSNKKKDEALTLGAHRYLDMSDAEAVKAHFHYFDYILCTADGHNMPYDPWLNLGKVNGTFCIVGIPNGSIPVNPIALLIGGIKIEGSLIGSRKAIEEMLHFAAEKNVRPIIERMPMSSANVGLKKVRDGSVRFRVVLENPKRT